MTTMADHYPPGFYDGPNPDHCTECPWCGGNAEAEFTDIGIGEQQVGPYRCDKCEATQFHPYDLTGQDAATEHEKKLQWWAGENGPRVPFVKPVPQPRTYDVSTMSNEAYAYHVSIKRRNGV